MIQRIANSLSLLLVFAFSLVASAAAHTVVFYESGFPSADSPAASESALRTAFADAEFANAAQLSSVLENSQINLLVMPYGSAYPEATWPAILRYLDRGGNLLALGESRLHRRHMKLTESGSCASRAWRRRLNF